MADENRQQTKTVDPGKTLAYLKRRCPLNVDARENVEQQLFAGEPWNPVQSDYVRQLRCGPLMLRHARRREHIADVKARHVGPASGFDAQFGVFVDAAFFGGDVDPASGL